MNKERFIELRRAAERLGIGYRHARKLAAHGALKLKAAEAHPDGRVRWLVSVRSVDAYARTRAKRGSR